MTAVQGIVLGIVQGLTEFLPVSSSGHLALGSALMGLPAPGLSLSVMVHFGTAVAAVVVLWRDIALILSRLLGGRGPSGHRAGSLPFVIRLVVASIPAALVGLFAEGFVDKVFSSPVVAAVGLIVTGFILRLPEAERRVAHRRDHLGEGRELPTVSWAAAITVGIAQAVAIVPGISRSGTTITAGLLSGLDGDDAARFSFLLSLPAVFGALLLDLRRAGSTEVLFSAPALAGAAAAFIAGAVALKAVFQSVRKGRLAGFAYYCWLVGAVSLAIMLVRR